MRQGLHCLCFSSRATGWAYVRPELVKVVQEFKVQAEAHAAEQQRLKLLAPKGPRLSAAAVAAKEPFFVGRYEKSFAMSPSKQVGWTMPRYAEWRLLPTVVELWSDPDFAVDVSDAARDADLKVWSSHLDTVLGEMADFAIESRSAALTAILAATTALGEDDAALEAFDAVEALGSGGYGDGFFCRATSYVSCAECAMFFGPLQDVLQHVHVAHPRSSLWVHALKRDAVTLAELGPRVDLSLETACAWSAVLELAQLDETDDGLVTDAQLDAAFKGKKVVWENGPRGTKRRGPWKDVVSLPLRSLSPSRSFCFSGPLTDAHLDPSHSSGASRRRRAAHTMTATCSTCPSSPSRT